MKDFDNIDGFMDRLRAGHRWWLSGDHSGITVAIAPTPDWDFPPGSEPWDAIEGSIEILIEDAFSEVAKNVEGAWSGE